MSGEYELGGHYELKTNRYGFVTTILFGDDPDSVISIS